MNRFVVFLCVVALSSCNARVGFVAQDGGIPSKIKEEIRPLFEQLVDGYKAGDREKVLALMPEDKRGKYESGFSISEEKDMYVKEKYVVLNEFYQTGLKKGVPVNFNSGKDSHDYGLSLTPDGSEVYLSVGYFDLPEIQLGLIVVWIKVDGVWRLSGFQSGLLKLGQKDLVDWYEVCSTHYAQGDRYDAFIDLSVINQLIGEQRLPIIYQNEKVIREKSIQMMQELKTSLPFPDTIREVSSQPCVLTMYPNIEQDSLMPVIVYLSALQDSVSVAKECEALHANVGRVYPGLNKNNSKIIYRVLDADRQGVRYCFEKSTRE